MKVGDLKSPYKELALIIMDKIGEPRIYDGHLDTAFHWDEVDCNSFWNDVDDGKYPPIPKELLHYFRGQIGIESDGDEERNKRIIKYLEELGGVNRYGLNGPLSKYVSYYISEAGHIRCGEGGFTYTIPLPKEEIKLPKKGEKILVWDDLEDMTSGEFHSYDEDLSSPYLVVREPDLRRYIVSYKYWKYPEKTDEEAIFDETAKENMVNWNLEEFKSTHSRLYKSIIESLEKVKNM